MTGTHEKIRAISLAVLMVLSVVAGTVALTGTAAAANIGNAQYTNGDQVAGSVTDLNSTVAANEQTNVSSIAIDGSSAQQEDGVSFDGSFANVEDSDVTIVIRESNGEIDEEFVNDATVGSVSEQNERITVDKTGENITVGADQKLEVLINGAFTNPGTAGNYSNTEFIVNPGASNENVATGVITVVAGTGATAGADIAVPDAYWETNATRYQGQQLQVWNLPVDRSYELETCDSFDTTLDSCDGSFVDTVDIDDDGNTTIDTTDLAGKYAIRTNESEYAIIGDKGEFIRFEEEGNLDFSPDTEIVVQNFSASFSQDTVARGNQISLDVESERRSDYKIEIASDQLTSDQMEDLFEGATDEDAGATANVSVNLTSSDASLTFAPPRSFETGNYDFTVNVVDTTADDTASTEVVDQSTAQADFTQGVYTAERGDNAEITLDIGDATDNVYVTVGSEDVNYKATVRVFDDNDDGDVSFNMNTFLAGRDPGNETEAYTGTDGDRVSFANVEHTWDGDQVPRPLESAQYDLTAAVGQDRSQTDAAVMSLGVPSLSGSALYTAPSRLDSDDSARYADASDVRDDATKANTIADGNHFIFQVNTGGLYAYTEDTSDFNVEKGVDNQSQVIATLTLDQAGREINAENGSAIDITKGNLVTDEDNDTFYVAFDTDDFDLESGQQYELNFTAHAGEQSPFNGDDQSTTQTFRVRDRQASFDTEQGIVTVEPESNQTISGTTNAAPGTEMTIRARSNTFFKTRSVTVQDDRSFSGEFDFSDVSENTSFTVLIPNQNFDNDAETTGRVGQAKTASVTLDNQTFTGQASSVNVASVTTSDGGFVTIHDSTLADDPFGSVRGTSAYLEPGTQPNVKVDLDSPITESGTFYAMPHLDTDGDQTYDFVTSEGADDSPYTTNEGNAVTDSAQITVEEPTPTPTPEPTPTPTEEMTPTPTDEETPTPTDEETPTDTEEETTTSDGQPGFGLAVSLIALVGAALIALRRRD